MVAPETSSPSRFEELPPSPPPLSPASSSSSQAEFEDAPSAAQTPHDDDDASKEDEDEENDNSIWYTPSELRDILTRSTALKTLGNAAFGKGDYESAIGLYRDGLVELPVRTQVGKGKGKEVPVSSDSGEASSSSKTEEEVGDEEKERKDVTGENEEEDEEVRELRSVLFANVGACYIRLKKWKEAVTACSDALEENPDYVKALSRRSLANEEIGSWSSLSAALEDQKRLNTLSPSPTVTSALARLPALIATQQEKEKDEVLGKLKDLGNTVLGKFGLSTDNFKFTPQEGGGYSFNFAK